MALRAKAPIIKNPRLKVLIYSDKGAGKTHFCCSIPETYYIDTENLEDYPKFTTMLLNNGGQLVKLNELTDIITEVKELLSTKHHYKTLIIDSLSFPSGWLSQLEVERLNKKDPTKEGTEFGANVAKSKRFVFQLGILLSRLDMNVIVTAHEKAKFVKDKEVGTSYDISDKMGYSLGSVWNLKLFGDNRKMMIEKSRYDELPNNTLIDFENGYEILKSKFGENIFVREAISEILCTPDQIKELKSLICVLNVSEEIVQKWLIKANSSELSEMSSDNAGKCIEMLRKKIP